MIRRSLCAAAALAAMATAGPALAGTATITLTNVRPNAGDLYISLQSEDQFMQAAAVAGEKVVNPQTDTVTVTAPSSFYTASVQIHSNGEAGLHHSPKITRCGL